MKRIITLAVLLLSCLNCSKEGGTDDRLVGMTFRTDAFLKTVGEYHCIRFETATCAVSYWVDKNGKQSGAVSDLTYELNYPELTTIRPEITSKYRFTSKSNFEQTDPEPGIYEKINYSRQL